MYAVSLISVSQITKSKPEDKVWALHLSKTVSYHSERRLWVLKQEQQNDSIPWKYALWRI